MCPFGRSKASSRAGGRRAGYRAHPSVRRVLVGAVGRAWHGSRLQDPELIVDSGGETLCASVASVSNGVLDLKPPLGPATSGLGTSHIRLAELDAMTPASSCPTLGGLVKLARISVSPAHIMPETCQIKRETTGN